MRLQKFLASSGVASRRKSEKLIREGIVRVNGKTITQMGFKVNPKKDSVFVKDKEIKLTKEHIYILLNKPTGYVTTVSDQFNRRTVMDLVDLPYRIFPVGRLDYDTSGLLILTNDGELTYKLTHPKFEISKTYIAKIKGLINRDNIKRFKQGIKIDNYITSPAEIKVLEKDKGNNIVEITIREGRNRQIRKMCKALGHPVISLKRIAMGQIVLDQVATGKWRYLTKEELGYLKNIK